jgi:hypothetical protein
MRPALWIKFAYGMFLDADSLFLQAIQPSQEPGAAQPPLSVVA